MAPDDSSGARPAAPIVLRIKLRYDDVEAMVARFATNVGKSGLFLPTKSLQPIGAEIKFELRLSDDTPVLVGLGRVKAAAAPDPSQPRATFGMAIELMRVTPQSRALILRMLDRRRVLGLPELGLPMPADIDAARRLEAVGAATRDPASGPVPIAPSAPSAPSMSDAPVAPIEAPPGEALLTAPRRQTGPMAAAKVSAVVPLAPELPRRKRLAISEIIDSASGPVASVSVVTPGLDDTVDLAAAILRARTLAGDGLDAELAALSEGDAAPPELSIEAASAELAKQLGGSAVRRDRSARWMPSPVTTAAATAIGSAPFMVEEPAAAPPDPAAVAVVVAPEPDLPPERAAEAASPDRAAGDPGALSVAAPDVAPSVAEPVASSVAEPVAPSVAEPVAPSVAEPVAPSVAEPVAAPPEVDPAQIADDLPHYPPHDELDLDDAEHTEMGEIPIGLGLFDHHGSGPDPAAVDQALLAARLEAHLLAAEAEAAADDLALAVPVYSEPSAGESDRAALPVAPPEDADPEPPLELNLEEVDEFEILAEADADDADLLAAHGEQEASSSHDLHHPLPAAVSRPSVLDFAARLELEDDHDLYFAVSPSEFATHHVVDGLPDGRPEPGGQPGAFVDARPRPDPHLVSAGHALAGFETGDDPLVGLETGDESLEETGDVPLDEPEPPRVAAPPPRGVKPIFDEDELSSSFTLAASPSESGELDFLSLLRPDPGVATRPLKKKPGDSPAEPAILRDEPRPRPARPPIGDDELESALEALDVDLDDLSTRNAVSRPPPRSEPARAHPHQVVRQPAPTPARGPAAIPSHAIRPTGPAPVPSRTIRPPGPVPTPSRTIRPTGPVPTPSRAIRPTGPVPPASAPAPRPPRVRMPTDDGIVIDFDDDDE